MTETEVKELALEVSKENKKEFDALKTEFESKITPLTDEQKAQKDLIEALNKKVEGLSFSEKVNSIKEFVKSEEAKELQANINKARKTNERVSILKAPATVTTTSATGQSTLNDSIAFLQGLEVTIPELKDAWINQFLSVSTWNQRFFRFSEWRKKDGEADHIAETELKPQIDIEMRTSQATAHKVAAWMELSDEAEIYLPDVMNAAFTILRAEVLREYVDKILFGDGTDSDPVGVFNIATVLDTTAWDTSVPSPNLYDVLSIAVSEISSQETNTIYTEVEPNLIMLNPRDWTQLRLTKNNDGSYIFPNGVMDIDGIMVAKHSNIPVGEFIVADFTKYNVLNVIEYQVEAGRINDQFITNMFCLLGEKHYITYVKEEDKRAFKKGNIESIKNAIEQA